MRRSATSRPSPPASRSIGLRLPPRPRRPIACWSRTRRATSPRLLPCRCAASAAEPADRCLPDHLRQARAGRACARWCIPACILDPSRLDTLPAFESGFIRADRGHWRTRDDADRAGGGRTLPRELLEWQIRAIPRKAAFLGFREAVGALLHPADRKAAEGDTVARRRIGYDELLASQIALALVRRQQKKIAGRATSGDGGYTLLAISVRPALRAHRRPGARRSRTSMADSWPSLSGCCGCCRAMSARARPWSPCCAMAAAASRPAGNRR